MHYPVMTEKHVADRWQVSLKTLRRWRLDGEGPVWHKLFRHVRYHEADVLEFEHSSAQHLMTLLGIKRETSSRKSQKRRRASMPRLKTTTSPPRKSPKQHRYPSTCSAIKPSAIANAFHT